ncbi:MAG: hypothetical protein OQK04_06380 [Kangiellaceae bacterium]|nr:hypothetical protein [Kangiellaceae bacterium]MCW8998325.1 hypothetical protein [Kangiellaceae bacterium]
MNNAKTIALIFSCLLSISACGSPASNRDSAQTESNSATPATAPTTSTDQEQEVEPEYQYQGTVTYIGLEGGFYGVVTKSGKKLLPMNLDKKYLQDGAIIQFNGKLAKGMMTIQQWGTPFNFSEVKLVKRGKQSSSDIY